MKKIILSLTIALVSVVGANAQDYNTGIGLRGGLYNGLTVKHFLSSNKAVEGLFTSRWGGFMVTGLLEFHNPIKEVNRLHWYYGVGAHIGFWNSYNNHPVFPNRTETYMLIGVDFILGMEYNFEELPFNISLDWKPAYSFVGYSRFWGDGGALSIRYIF
jgi:hypothetical protein